MPEPGPLTPTRDAETGLGPIPGPPAPWDEVSTALLSADEVRLRLAARERDIKYHLEALKHEATTVFDDVNVGGRPLMDRIRAEPLKALAASAGTALVLGVLSGLRARAKRRRRREAAGDDVVFVRARLAQALEDAAHRVAAGEDTDVAIRRSMASVPVAYASAEGAAAAQARSSTREVVDVMVKSAAGFAAKAVIDQVVRRYTGHEEMIEALKDAAD